MTILQAVVLGIIQGLTEFLPVSSSGHLVLFSQLFNVEEPSLLFEVIVHVGTLLAVLAVFRQEVAALVAAYWKLLTKPTKFRQLMQDQDCRLAVALVLGTIPAVVAALLLKERLEQFFSSSLFVGVMLIVTGLILYLTEKRAVRGRGRKVPGLGDALFIGCGQAVAILPGVSRSGTTMAAGLLRGLDKERAAKFSFLLAIPAILGALVLSLVEVLGRGTTLSAGALGAGLVSSAITGYAAITFFLQLVRKGRLVWFSYYTWLVGGLVIVLHLL